MKICIISPLFEPWLVGGAEKYVSMLASCLSEEHEVTLVTTQGPQPRSLPYSHGRVKIYEIKPFNVCSLYDLINKPKSMMKWQKLIYHLLDIWKLEVYLEVRKILRRVKPNVVHTNGIKGLSPSIFSAIRKSRIPHVHTLHDYELISRWVTLFRKGSIIYKFNMLDQIYMNLMRTISSQVSAVISPSNFVMDFHVNLGYFKKSDKYVIPNPSEILKGTNLVKDRNKEFICLGQLAKIKGFHVAIAAFKRVKELDTKLHIVGGGEYVENLRNIAGSDERIIFHGYINQYMLEQIFNKCFFGIVPSIWYEPFGLVINEMMMRGIPVIASNIGGIPEIVKDGHNGFLVTPGNVDCFHNLIEKALSMDVLSNMSNNAVISASKFSIREHRHKIVEVYNISLSKLC